jgi:hypothetical protein
MEFELRGGSIIYGKYVPRGYGTIMNTCIHENVSSHTNPEVMAIIQKYKDRGFGFTVPSDQHNHPEMDKHDMLCRDVFTDKNPEPDRLSGEITIFDVLRSECDIVASNNIIRDLDNFLDANGMVPSVGSVLDDIAIGESIAAGCHSTVITDEKSVREKRKNETDNTGSNKKIKQDGEVECVDMEYVD